MKIVRPGRLNERGVALVLVGMLLVLFMTFVGLAIDLGRAYIIRSALATAVDGAALAAARQLPQGQNAANIAANNIFNANFPPGFLGAGAVNKNVGFSTAADGSDLITINADITMPTSFMRVAGFNGLKVSSAGQATRRLVDMAFVIDRSGSLGGAFPAVQTASSDFVGKFDTTFDRIALVSFSTNTIVHDQIRTPATGFNKGAIQGNIAALQSNGNTATSEGLYQGWNQLRLVPRNNQSGLRVVVLFTDGTPNAFAGAFQRVATTCTGNPCVPGPTFVPITGTVITGDYPNVGFGTTDTPADTGLHDTYNTTINGWNTFVNGTNVSYTTGAQFIKTTVNASIPELPNNPAMSRHTPQQGASAGIPTGFLLYDGTLPNQRLMIGAPPYQNHVQNTNNAARNVMESIANAIRTDATGKAPIHIFTLGLGALLNVGTGSGNETGTSMLRRVSNDPASPDYQPNQPDGGYFFAGNVGDLAAAFEAIRDRIIRISQ